MAPKDFLRFCSSFAGFATQSSGCQLSKFWCQVSPTESIQLSSAGVHGSPIDIEAQTKGVPGSERRTGPRLVSCCRRLEKKKGCHQFFCPLRPIWPLMIMQVQLYTTWDSEARKKCETWCSTELPEQRRGKLTRIRSSRNGSNYPRGDFRLCGWTWPDNRGF